MSEVVDQKYELVPIASIKPHPDNPRKGNVELISESVDANGFYGACIVQASTRYILAGSHRWRAAVEQQMEMIPVMLVEVDDETALRILLADNRTNDTAGYDDDVLNTLLNDLAERGDLFGSGYDPDAVDDLLARTGGIDLDIEDVSAMYAEDVAEIEARAAQTTNSKAAQGLREVILVFPQDEYEVFISTVQTLRLQLKTDSTSATVLKALTGE